MASRPKVRSISFSGWPTAYVPRQTLEPIRPIFMSSSICSSRALRWNWHLRQLLISLIVPNWTKTRRTRRPMRIFARDKAIAENIVRIATHELLISCSTKRRHRVSVIATVGSMHLQRQEPAGSRLDRLDHRRAACHGARQHLSNAIVASHLGCQLGVQYIVAGALDRRQRKLNEARTVRPLPCKALLQLAIRGRNDRSCRRVVDRNLEPAISTDSSRAR